MNKRLRKKLDRQLDKFLAKKIESPDGRYAPWTDKDLEALYEIMWTIRDLKEEPDYDGDPSLGFVIYARNIHEPFHLYPVERSDRNPVAHMCGVLTNFRIAQQDYGRIVDDVIFRAEQAERNRQRDLELAQGLKKRVADKAEKASTTTMSPQEGLVYALQLLEAAKAEGLMGGSQQADKEFEANVAPIRDALRKAKKEQES